MIHNEHTNYQCTYRESGDYKLEIWRKIDRFLFSCIEVMDENIWRIHASVIHTSGGVDCFTCYCHSSFFYLLLLLTHGEESELFLEILLVVFVEFFRETVNTPFLLLPGTTFVFTCS